MRKTLMLMAALAVLVILAAPAAGKGKPPQEPSYPELPDCAFSAVVIEGASYNVLHYESEGGTAVWVGSAPLLCEWTVESLPTEPHRFAIEAVPGEGNRSFSGPYLLIKEEHMGTDVCYREYYNGKVIGSAEFPIDPAESIILPDVDEDGNQCPSWDADSPDMDGANTFTITVYVNRAQGGPVWLRMLP